MPTKVGTQTIINTVVWRFTWIPACAGMTEVVDSGSAYALMTVVGFPPVRSRSETYATNAPPNSVMPTKVGTQTIINIVVWRFTWIPASAGMTRVVDSGVAYALMTVAAAITRNARRPPRQSEGDLVVERFVEVALRPAALIGDTARITRART